jgi:hypothetical protein
MELAREPGRWRLNLKVRAWGRIHVCQHLLLEVTSMSRCLLHNVVGMQVGTGRIAFTPDTPEVRRLAIYLQQVCDAGTGPQSCVGT